MAWNLNRVPVYRLLTRLGWLGFFTALCMLFSITAWGQAAATITTLFPSASYVSAGTYGQFLISVTSGGKPVTGQVLLCDDNAPICEGPAILATAQLSSSGTTLIRLEQGPGLRAFKAIYVGNKKYAASSSAREVIQFGGVLPTKTSLTSTKATTGYNFTAALSGTGILPLTGAVSFLDSTDGNVLLGTANPGASTGTLGFTPTVASPTATAPVAIAIGDFNGDGIPDLAVVNNASNSVTPLLGLGDGTFENPQTGFMTGLSPSAIVAGDFNNDGIVDLAVANAGDNTVTYYYGNGNGGFTLGGRITTGVGPSSLVTGDFNRDGQIDLAVVNRGETRVSILLGTGSSFSAVSTKLATGATPYGIAMGDFNSDGNPDLVVPNYFSNTVTVYLGHGDGTFSAPSTLPVGTYPSAVVVGDFNGDGKGDLAVTNSFTKSVTLYLGNGLGQFKASVPALVTETNPGSIAIGDFNLDGKQDLAVANYGSNSVDVYIGNGDGTFQAKLSIAVGASPGALVAGDFNIDGLTDLLVANTTLNQVHPILNSFTTAATASISSVVPLGAPSQAVFATLAADSNYAPSTSAHVTVTGTPIPTTTRIFLGASVVAVGELVQIAATVQPSPYGNLAVSAPVTLTDSGTILGKATPVNGVASFNISFPAPGTHSFKLALAADGTFAGSTSTTAALTVVASTTSTTSLTTSAPSVAHGTITVLTATVTSGGQPVTHGTVNFCKGSAAHCSDISLLSSVQLTSNGTAVARLALPLGSNAIQAVFKGNGLVKGSNSAIQSVTVTGTYPVAMTLASSGTAGNYNLTASIIGQSGHALPSATVQLVDTSNANLALGSSYTLPQQVPFSFKSLLTGLGHAPFSVASGDFNNDGKMDAMVVDRNTGTVTVQLGNGDGSFKPVPSNLSLGTPWGLAIGDFNGDGKLDFALTNTNGNNVNIELGNGDGTFTTKSSLATGNAPTAIVAADFNGDGILDLVITNYFSGDLTILLGNGDGTFRTDAMNVGSIGISYGLVAADFDGDGNMDLAVSSMSFGVVMLYGNGDGTFRVGNSPAVGSNAGTAVASGDFNGDGRADLVIATTDTGGSVTVFLNQGGGTFTPSLSIPTTDFIYSIAVTDVNADGIADLIWDDYSAGTLSVATGYGTGAFAVASQSVTNASLGMLSTGDFDQDGSSDVLLIDFQTSSVSLFLNRSISTATFSNVSVPGAGAHLVQASLAANGVYTTSASNTVSLTATPVTPSVVVVPSPGSLVAVGQAVTVTVSVLPDDNFAATGTAFLYDGTTLLKTATLTNGQMTDTLTFATVGTHNFSAIYDGSTTLTPAQSAITPVYVTAASTTTLALSSAQVAAGTAVLLKATTVNAAKVAASSGTVNFCVATVAPCTGSALLGTAQIGTAGIAQVNIALPIGSYSIKAVFQGNQSLLSSSSTAVALAVTGLKATTTQLTSTGSAGTYSLTARVTGPGTLPVTGTMTFTNSSTRTALGSAALTAGTTQLSFLPVQNQVIGTSVSRMVAGDFDNDGKPDVVVLDSPDNILGFMPGNGNGAVTAKSGFSFNVAFNCVAVGDFNGDGKLDLVIGSPQVLYGTSQLTVMFGNGDGTFTNSSHIFIPGPANQIAVGDFNRDGKLDILVIDFSQTITVVTNTGNGFFSVASIPVTGVSGMQSVTVADFNGDGNLDVAVTTFGHGIQIYLGDGAGNFTLSTIPLLTTALPGGIVSVDLNKDGKMDLAVTDYATSKIIILLGKGDGTFTQGTTLAPGFLPSSLAAGDFNLDGNVDLVAFSLSSNGVACLLGNGTGAFTIQGLTLPPTAQPSSMVVADFNHDGQPDVLIGDSSVGLIYGLINNLSTSATATIASAKITGTTNQTVNATYSGSPVYAAGASNVLTLAP